MDNTSVLTAEGRQHTLPETEWSYEKMFLSCDKGRVSRVPLGVANLRAGMLSRGNEAQVWSLGTPACQRLFKRCKSSGGLICEQEDIQCAQLLLCALSDRKALGVDALKYSGMARRPEICFPSPNTIQLVLERLVKGRGTNHSHAHLARPELVAGNESGKRTIKEVPALRVASVECRHRGSNLQGY